VVNRAMRRQPLPPRNRHATDRQTSSGGPGVTRPGRTVHRAERVAVSPPGTDESKLPPSDRTADGIGVVDTTTLTLRIIFRGRQDPEQTSVSRDGTRLYIANEDRRRRAWSTSPAERRSPNSRSAARPNRYLLDDLVGGRIDDRHLVVFLGGDV